MWQEIGSTSASRFAIPAPSGAVSAARYADFCKVPWSTTRPEPSTILSTSACFGNGRKIAGFRDSSVTFDAGFGGMPVQDEFSEAADAGEEGTGLILAHDSSEIVI